MVDSLPSTQTLAERVTALEENQRLIFGEMLKLCGEELGPEYSPFRELRDALRKVLGVQKP